MTTDIFVAVYRMATKKHTECNVNANSFLVQGKCPSWGEYNGLNLSSRASLYCKVTYYCGTILQKCVFSYFCKQVDWFENSTVIDR